MRQIRKGGIAIGTAIAAFAIACGGGKGTEPKVPKGPTPTPPDATDVLKSSPTPLVTEVPTLPPTQEVKQEVPCQILPTEYCSQAELTDFNYQGQTLKIVGFHLPPDVPIFSPIDGSFGQTNMDQKPNTGPFHGFIALVFKPSDPSLLSFSIMGDIKFDNMLSHDVKKGDLIAYTQDTGIKNLGGNYNIIVTADRKNPNGNVPITITDEDMLRTMFPQAFEKSKK